MKKWVSSLFDHRLPLQERTFRLITAIGAVSLALMAIVAIALQEDLTDTLTIIGGLTAFLIIVGLSIKFHKVQLGASIIAFTVVFIMLPVIYISSGGMYGGTPVWFIFIAIFISFVLRGRRRVFYLIADGIVLIGCYALQWYYPMMIIPHTAKMAYTDSVVSTLTVGFVVSLMVIFVTKIYLNEQQLAEDQRRQIEEINRAQNRFFSNMSHEIRTPVNTIIGLNEMIIREATTAEVAEDARSIQGAGQMLLALINDILDLSKIESGNMELISANYEVSSLLSEVTDMVWSPAHEKGLAFHVDIDESTPRSLIGDKVRIKQILINLLNNAIKYTREGTVTLTVTCRRTQSPGTADLILSVTDTGIGIRKEALPMLFEVFRRVDESKNRYIEGSGLGLSIVKQLVELMGGEITVDSVYTKGSTFRVSIPQMIAQEEAIGKVTLRAENSLREQQAYEPSFTAPGAAALIVDDNELNISVAAKLLSATGMQIDTAGSGRDALGHTQEKHYDIILMDHLMPDMDGIETLHAIREQRGGFCRETPVIALTANAGSDNEALYRRSGFDGYLLKPITGSDLEAAVMSRLPRSLVKMTGVGTMDSAESQVADAFHRKAGIIITTDSLCDLPVPLLRQHRVEMIPLQIRTNEGVFADRLEVTTGETMRYLMKYSGKTIEASAPSIDAYENFFAGCLLRADHVFHITTSAWGEQTYKNATEAAKSFGNVTVFDTRQISAGVGAYVMRAASIIESGNVPPQALAGILAGAGNSIRCALVVDSTAQLCRSGRITARQNAMFQNFMLRPIFMPTRRGVKIRSFIGGPRKQYTERFIKRMISRAEADQARLYVVSPNMQPEEAAYLEEIIKKHVPFREIRFLQAGPSSTLVWGMDAIALIYETRMQ